MAMASPSPILQTIRGLVEDQRAKELCDIICDEVNVKEAIPAPDIAPGEVRLDTVITPELEREGMAREIIRAGQEERKKAGCTPSDRLTRVTVFGPDTMREVVREHGMDIKNALRADVLEAESADGLRVVIEK